MTSDHVLQSVSYRSYYSIVRQRTFQYKALLVRVGTSALVCRNAQTQCKQPLGVTDTYATPLESISLLRYHPRSAIDRIIEIFASFRGSATVFAAIDFVVSSVFDFPRPVGCREGVFTIHCPSPGNACECTGSPIQPYFFDGRRSLVFRRCREGIPPLPASIDRSIDVLFHICHHRNRSAIAIFTIRTRSSIDLARSFTDRRCRLNLASRSLPLAACFVSFRFVSTARRHLLNISLEFRFPVDFLFG